MDAAAIFTLLIQCKSVANLTPNRERKWYSGRLKDQMRSLRFVTLFTLSWFFALSFLGIYLAEGVVHQSRRKIDQVSRARANHLANEYRVQIKEASIASSDQSILRAWYFEQVSDQSNAVILLHGQGDNRAGMLGYAEMFLRHRYNVLIPDSRAHGESGGNLATYGVLESADLRYWSDWLMNQSRPSHIYGLGESMGAAILLQSLDKESRFCAVVAESPFSTFEAIAKDRVIGRPSKYDWIEAIAMWPVTKAALHYVDVRYNVDLRYASPETVVSQSSIPILLIHGTEDASIPLKHSIQLSSMNPAIQLWKVPGGHHTEAYGRYPREFEQRVYRWFEDHSHR